MNALSESGGDCSRTTVQIFRFFLYGYEELDMIELALKLKKILFFTFLKPARAPMYVNCQATCVLGSG